MKKIRKCVSCAAYTMQQGCPQCGRETRTAHPPKYSPVDKYAKYRRLLAANA
jgi:H/ACA ribonucleoprotein complex subunit 3